MTRRNMEDMPLNCSPSLDADGSSSMMSPPPPQASPADRSPPPLHDAPESPAMLATMTPVNVIELKKEMDEENGRGAGGGGGGTTDGHHHQQHHHHHHHQHHQPPLYAAHVKTEVISYDKDELVYSQGISDKGDTPIDLIYEDGNKTVIYTTAYDQKSLEIFSADNGGEITINNLSAHQIHHASVDDGMIDSNNHGGIDGNGGAGHHHHHHETSGTPPGTVSVVLQGNHQGLLQYQPSQVPTVLVLSEMTEDDGVPVIGLRTSSQTGSILTSQLKSTNGLVSGAGLELPTTPQLSSQDLQGLFINQHVGYTQPVAATAQNFQLVKREPEDLSHHRKLECTSPSSVSLDGTIINSSKQARHKVVLVSSSGGQHGDLVVDVNSVKDETHRGLNSPQHGSRSVNATPTSTHSHSSSLLADGSTTGPIEFITTDGIKPAMYATQIFAAMNNPNGHGGSGTPSPIPYGDHGGQYNQSAQNGNNNNSVSYAAPSSGRTTTPSATFTVSDPYYREYFTTVAAASVAGGATPPEPIYTSQLRQNQNYTDDVGGGGGATTTSATASFVERYVRQSYHSKGVIAAAAGLTVDLPSPDSGIGADAITPRDQNTLQQNYEYPEICPNPNILDPLTISQRNNSSSQSPGSQSTSRSRPWHDFGRQNDADKIQIQKIYSPVGFKYQLETPISTSQRREDDRITYINKGQFYGITLDYIPDPDKQLKSQTVKSIVMLMFREEKSPEDEIKAWQFWHGRQHSVKQRILDADTKNSVGLVGCIEEVAHNAIAIYWNPLESPAKINIAVQCLSTDFSSQKGVKGLPLHLQIDTYEDPRDANVYHRGYCQIKVFCDKGAERKTRDEERRAAKRKMTATGRKKLDELYHPMCERSEFYSMSDLAKPPVLFSPAEDIDKLTSMELQGFYPHDGDNSLTGPVDHVKAGSPFLLHTAAKPPTTPTLKFHNHFPPDADKKDSILDNSLTTDGNVFSPPLKRTKMMSGPGSAGPPPIHERVMLYVRQEVDDVYTPLHVVPPTTAGLLNAIENKYKISASSINNLYRKNKKGITAKIDDDMVAYYCNEDLFLLELKIVEEDLFDITFVELSDH